MAFNEPVGALANHVPLFRACNAGDGYNGMLSRFFQGFKSCWAAYVASGHTPARGMGHDHFVDIAAFGSRQRARETVLIGFAWAAIPLGRRYPGDDPTAPFAPITAI
jgi:hypothetical protein